MIKSLEGGRLAVMAGIDLMDKSYEPSHSQLLFELELCALEQGYGDNLQPLYKKPVLNFLTYLKLTKILNGGHYGFRKE